MWYNNNDNNHNNNNNNNLIAIIIVSSINNNNNNNTVAYLYGFGTCHLSVTEFMWRHALFGQLQISFVFVNCSISCLSFKKHRYRTDCCP